MFGYGFLEVVFQLAKDLVDLGKVGTLPQPSFCSFRAVAPSTMSLGFGILRLERWVWEGSLAEFLDSLDPCGEHDWVRAALGQVVARRCSHGEFAVVPGACTQARPRRASL